MKVKSLPEMISDLLASGLSYKQLAELTRCDTSTISRIKTGFISDPRYSVGESIARLHAERIKEAA